MCGIAGILPVGSTAQHQPALSAMLLAEAHRGPEASGEYADDHILLGHRRLRIIDLSEGGRQPMTDASGRYVITFNGEMYNYREVKAALPSYPFRTESDTEVILAAWAQWGPECIHRFFGMFAFALWDRQEQKLTLVRDRMGVKPLYYAQTPQALVFASEIRSLLASGFVKPRLRRETLSDYLTYQTVSAPDTLLQDVYMLEPGEYMTIHKGSVNKTRYYETGKTGIPDTRGFTYPQITAGIKNLLLSSVERRLVSDVPLGAFLSGGIDSSAVVALMAEVSDTPVQTFSVVFDEKEYDESQWSSLIAARYNTQHHPIRVRPAQFMEEIPSALSAMDHPSGDGPNSYVVSRVTKANGITVALSGIGGDELFAGYPFFRRMADLQNKKWITALPYFLRKPFAAVARKVPGGRRGEKIADILGARDFSLNAVLPLYRTLYSTGDAAALLLPDSIRANPVHAWMQARAGWLGQLPLLSQISVAEISQYMQNVLLRDTDQMSMAHALEVREPFLDHELVQFVLSVPDQHKYPSFPKRLLVDAMGDGLPGEVVHRKKMGFTFPWKHWMKNELRGFCETHLTHLEQRGIFRPGSVTQIWKQFLADHPRVLWNHLWLLVVLEDWMAKNKVEA